ncbi:MAG: hypothetical protein CM15mV111_150 [uncultured marine virus]|nr:MAG: hypothetical protein CM15mV111_150 [uncultured marine virus]
MVLGRKEIFCKNFSKSKCGYSKEKKAGDGKNPSRASFKKKSQRLLERIQNGGREKVATRGKTTGNSNTAIGFPEQKLQTASDSRAIRALRKAYLYDELMAKKPAAQKKVKGKTPKVTKSGKPP